MLFASLNRHNFSIPVQFTCPEISLKSKVPDYRCILLPAVSVASLAKREICLPSPAVAGWPLKGFILLGTH